VWSSFQGVLDRFLKNKQDQNCIELLVKKITKGSQNHGCCMSLKVDFYASIWFSFKKIFATSVKNIVNGFHCGFEPMERQDNGSWDSAMMSGYIWSSTRAKQSQTGHKGKACSTLHFCQNEIMI